MHRNDYEDRILSAPPPLLYDRGLAISSKKPAGKVQNYADTIVKTAAGLSFRTFRFDIPDDQQIFDVLGDLEAPYELVLPIYVITADANSIRRIHPLDIAYDYAKTIRFFMPEYRNATFLCASNDVVDIEAMNESDVYVHLYSDSSTLSHMNKIEDGLLDKTRFGKVIWNGSVPEELLVSYEDHLMTLEVHRILSQMKSMLTTYNDKNEKTPLYRKHEEHLNIDSQDLIEIFGLLSYGNVQFNQAFCAHSIRTSKSPLHEVPEYMNDIFITKISELYTDDAIKNMDFPKVKILDGIIQIWKKIYGHDFNIFSKEAVSREARRAEDDYGLSSFVGALCAGVPLRDVLA